MEIKEHLENKGYDFKQFLEDLETVSNSQLTRDYPVSYNWVIYLKGKYGYPMSCYKRPRSKYDMDEGGYSVNIPRIWRKHFENPDEVRDILYNALIKKGMQNGLGLRNKK
jgi:hypothetical protein